MWEDRNFPKGFYDLPDDVGERIIKTRFATKVNDNIDNDINSSSGQLPDKHRGKTVSKGRPKRK